MKALYISYDAMTDPLGQSQVIPYLLGLTKKGYNFTILSYEKRDRYTHFGQKLRKQLNDSYITWRPFRYHKRFSVAATSYDIFLGFIYLLFFIPARRIKILHCRSYVSSILGLLFYKVYGTKFIFDMRGFWADERVEGRIWKSKGFLYHSVKFIEKHFFKCSDEIVVLTNRAREIIKDWGYKVNNVSVIPCCVDVDHFKFDRESRVELRKKHNLDDKFIFVHAGSLEYWYMKKEMLDYFKVAKGKFPNTHFLILTHSDKNIILELILRKNLSLDDFSILSVSFEDMPKYLSIADAGLIFITPVFSKQASSPTKFAEYLSCGLPVVINSKIGDLESYVETNNIGTVIREFNETEYAASLHRLSVILTDKDIKERCRKVANDNFALKVGIDKYQQIYSRLMK